MSESIRQPVSAEYVHVLIFIAMGTGLVGTVRGVELLVWGGVVVLAAAGGFVVRWVGGGTEAQRLVVAMRASSGALGLVWGAGAAVMLIQVDAGGALLVLLGLGAAVAVAALPRLADPIGFHAFLGGALMPLPIGVWGSPSEGVGWSTLTTFGIAAAAGVVLFGHAHRSMVARFDDALRSRELTRGAASAGTGWLPDFLSTVPVPMVAVDGLGRVVGANAAMERLFGYPGSDALGARWADLIVPQDDRDGSVEANPRSRTQLVPRRPMKRLRADGRSVLVSVSLETVPWAEPSVTCIAYHDVTDLVESTARDAEGVYHELIASGWDLVFKTDRDLRWTFLTPAAERIYGTAPENLVGTRMDERVTPAHREQDAAAFAAVLSGSELADYQTEHRDVQGGTRHLSFTVRPVRDAWGEVVGLQGLARDVTANATALHSMHEARLAAEAMARARGSFLANMSHEIRTPMNGVLGMVEMLLETNLDGEQRKAADVIRTSAGALLSLINDILDFSKIESGHLTMEETPFDLHALVDSVARVLAGRAFDKDVELAYHVHGDVPQRVIGDPGRLRQVLTNLVGNAVKFTAAGEIVITVSRQAASEGDAIIEFEVRDTGSGIPTDRLETIFEEFAQADASTARKFGGTGLGLAISRRLVSMMGGDLKVESEVGKGSTFSFAIPIVLEVSTDPTKSPRPATRLRDRRVLLVGGQESGRRIATAILRDAGMIVSEVEDAARALDVVRRGRTRFEIALVDTFLPGRDGFDLASRLGQGDDDLKVMVLTSAGQRGDAQRCRELGIAAYITKPVSRPDLLEATAAVLAGTQPTPGSSKLVTRHSIHETRERIRVLVADDNQLNQEVAAAMLRKRGHMVEVVDSGQAAVDSVASGRYQLVLMDLQMPEIDGFEATRRIRELPNGGDIPIIALTASAVETERDRCAEAGMDAYLSKPFRPHELFAVVEGWGIEDSETDTSWDQGDDGDDPVDFDAFRTSMREAGIEDAIDSMLGVFLRDAPLRMRGLEDAVAARDVAAIEAASHAFRSAASTIRASNLTTMLHEVEVMCRRDELTGEQTRLHEIKAEHVRVLTFLHRLGENSASHAHQ